MGYVSSPYIFLFVFPFVQPGLFCPNEHAIGVLPPLWEDRLRIRTRLDKAVLSWPN